MIIPVMPLLDNPGFMLHHTIMITVYDVEKNPIDIAKKDPAPHNEGIIVSTLIKTENRKKLSVR